MQIIWKMTEICILNMIKDKNDFLVALNSSLNGNSEYRDKIQEVKNLLYSKDNQCAVCEKTLLEMDKIDE